MRREDTGHVRDAIAVVGWSSGAEHVLSEVELTRERELVEIDARVGDEAAREYGAELSASGRAPFYLRYPRGALRRLRQSPIGALGKRAVRRAERERWRIRHRLARGHSLEQFPPGLELAAVPADDRAGNDLLAATASTHLVFVRDGAELTTDGAAAIADAIAHDPDVELLYGDSRRRNGVRFRAPAFSPLRLREEDYLGPIVVVSVRALRARGGFRSEADGALLLDFALRTPALAVRRLREVLGVGEPFDRPSGAEEAAAAGVVRAVLESSRVGAVVTTKGGIRSVEYEIEGEPLVSIIIPTRGSSGIVAGSVRTFVTEAVRGICDRTTWRNVEIVVVADDATPQVVIEELIEIAGDRLVLVRWSEPFNFSAKMNRGIAVSRGEYLLMLNDDIDIVTPDWIEHMLGLAQQPGVGMVGALLYFEDGAVQHLGHIYQGGGAGHVAFGIIPGALAPLAELAVTREVSGATAACALLPVSVVRDIGGFSTQFPGNYNDVDMSLKVRSAGYSVVVTGAARLYHFESRTREATVLPSEFASLARRWSSQIHEDEYSRELEN